MKKILLMLLLSIGTASAKDVADFGKFPGARIPCAYHSYALFPVTISAAVC